MPFQKSHSGPLSPQLSWSVHAHVWGPRARGPARCGHGAGPSTPLGVPATPSAPWGTLTLTPKPTLACPGSPFSPFSPFIPGRPWGRAQGRSLLELAHASLASSRSPPRVSYGASPSGPRRPQTGWAALGFVLEKLSPGGVVPRGRAGGGTEVCGPLGPQGPGLNCCPQAHEILGPYRPPREANLPFVPRPSIWTLQEGGAPFRRAEDGVCGGLPPDTCLRVRQARQDVRLGHHAHSAARPPRHLVFCPTAHACLRWEACAYSPAVLGSRALPE